MGLQLPGLGVGVGLGVGDAVGVGVGVGVGDAVGVGVGVGVGVRVGVGLGVGLGVGVGDRLASGPSIGFSAGERLGAGTMARAGPPVLGPPVAVSSVAWTGAPDTTANINAAAPATHAIVARVTNVRSSCPPAHRPAAMRRSRNGSYARGLYANSAFSAGGQPERPSRDRRTHPVRLASSDPRPRRSHPPDGRSRGSRSRDSC